jgi:FkbM family methyltransferase
VIGGGPMRVSRWLYYLSSIPTLVVGVRNWPSLAAGLLRKDRSVTVELRDGLRFKARSALDVWVIKETCLDRGYEKASVPIQDGWTILDIGAGLGAFTVDAARKSPQGVVYAYEPFPASFALLEHNLALNDIRNAHLYPLAVSAHSGALLLKTDPGEAVMHRAGAHLQDGGDGDAIPVTATSLDRAFDDLNLSRCDFLKIDSEGAEYEILLNASPVTLHKVRHICLEYHDGFTTYSHLDLVDFLEAQGFAVRLRTNPAHGYLGLLHAANRAAPG